MSFAAVLKRYVSLYLPSVVVGGFFVFIGLEGLIPALDGEIPKLKGAERLIYLADSPDAFWFEVFQRVFMLLMALVCGVGLALMRRSDEASDKAILRRIQNDAALDKAVRRPLQPD
mgnify:CR=1 FL=1|jgi:hypothetical protein